MRELNYEQIQAEIERPGRLCLHCGRCMPIVDGENFNSGEIEPDAIRGPVSVWDEYPEECGFSGWLFQEREKQKHKIRKIKEQIHYFSFFPKDFTVGKDTTAEQKITQLQNQIFPWYRHGAENW